MQLKSVMKIAFGGLLIGSTLTGTALALGAQVNPIPEVDPGMMGVAIAFLTGGYLIISSRRRGK